MISAEIAEKKVDTAFSRMKKEQSELVAPILENFTYDPLSRLGWTEYRTIEPNDIVVAVLSAGSTDVPVAEEAARIAEFFGSRVKRFYDVGVAGIHRLMEVMPEVAAADAVIVAAGMDGALPSVVSGLVSSLVVGLPTSVGYGVAEDGKTALRSMLCSCSPGLVVVNIDNGVGAGIAAVMSARKISGCIRPGR